jgi:hypothetical protein
MTPEEICSSLHRLLSDKTHALERGAKDRARIAQIIEEGGVPSGHRVDWLRETAEAVNLVLIEQAKEFNRRYPGDVVSVDDFLDVLATLRTSFRKG